MKLVQKIEYSSKEIKYACISLFMAIVCLSAC